MHAPRPDYTNTAEFVTATPRLKPNKKQYNSNPPAQSSRKFGETTARNTRKARGKVFMNCY